MLRTLPAIMLALGLVVGLAYFAIYATTQVGMDTAERRGQAGEQERVEADGGYRVAAYDEFYDLCSTVQAQQDKVENLEAHLAAAADPDQREMLQSGITAQRNTMAENAREYNAKAAEGTRGQFRDSELPYEIEPDEEVECGSV